MIPPLSALIRLHEINLEAPVGDETIHHSSEKNRLLQSLTPTLHKRYMQMYRRHGISAVAPMERSTCSGCHMRQPSIPAVVAEDVFECQSCGRLIYDPDTAFEYNVG